MTRGSVLEYAAAVRDRYRAGKKQEKGRILDEFTEATGYHRKAAIRILLKRQRHPMKRRGRSATYSGVVEPLKTVWEACDRICSKRLQPFMPEMVKVLRHHGEQSLNLATEKLLCRMSPSTIDRLLRPARLKGGRRGFSTTKPGSLLKESIPIRTFADWEDSRPGFLEIDLVAHCSESTEGFYLNTLSAVDVSSGWTECLPVWGKGQQRVRTALHRIRLQLPFSLLGVDSDNGSEFINQCFYSYCDREKITFTRSRAYKKNDSCHVEQKNWSVVRRLVGYDRYSSQDAYRCMERVYRLVRLYTNFFQPTMKLWSKTRNGARVHKVYEEAQTPYQRLLQSGVLTEEKKADLASTYTGLNPVDLKSKIDATLEQLWRLADHPDKKTRGFGNRNSDATTKASVTV